MNYTTETINYFLMFSSNSEAKRWYYIIRISKLKSLKLVPGGYTPVLNILKYVETREYTPVKNI